MAVTGTFITHGGFEIIRDAWLYISNLMNNPQYHSAITAIFLAGVVLGATMGPWRNFLRAFDWYGWMLSAMGALFMYGLMFQAGFHGWHLTGKMVVRDDVLNKSQTIDNLPAGLVAMASALNHAQVGMEKLIESTITGPYTSDTSEVALSTKMLREATTGKLKATMFELLPEQFIRSVWSYIEKDLSYVASANPEVAEELKKTSDLKQAYSDGANPAILDVVTWLDRNGNPQNYSETVDGKDAWDRIKAFMDHRWPDIMSRFCIQFGFDSSALSINACKRMLNNALNSFLVSGKTADNFTKDILLGSMWNKYLEQLDSNIALSNILSSMRTQSTLTSTGISAEQWLPHLKIVITALVIGITPVVMLLVASTFYFSAARFLFSLYLWLLMWAVMDKVAEGFWIAYSQHVWDAVNWANGGAGVGVLAQDMYWALASQTLAVLGGMRSVSMMLAGVTTYGIFGFGGSMLAHLAGGIVAQVGSGASQGASAVHPSREAEVRVSQQAAYQTEWAAQNRAMSSADWFGLGTATARQNQMKIGQYGSLDGVTAERAGYQQARDMLAKTDVLERLTDGDILLKTAQEYAQGIAKGRRTEMAAERYGTDMITAEGIMSGVQSLGSLTTEQKEKVLDDVFGKGFSTFIKNYAKKNNLDYEKVLSGFDDLRIKAGVPGSVVDAQGVVQKQGLKAFAAYLKNLGKTETAAGLMQTLMESQQGKGEGRVALDVLGTYEGAALMNTQAGSEFRRYDLVHDKFGVQMPISWKEIEQNPILKETMDAMYEQAKAEHRWGFLDWMKWAEKHPNEEFYLEYQRGRNGKFAQVWVKNQFGSERTDVWNQKGNIRLNIGGVKVPASGWMEQRGETIIASGSMGKMSVGYLLKGLRKAGDQEGADKVKALFDRMRPDDRVAFEAIYGKDGKLAKLIVGNQVVADRTRSFKNMDVFKEKSETDIMPYHSTVETAWEFLHGNDLVAQRYVEQAQNYGTRALQYQAVQEAKAVEQFFKHQGAIKSQFSLSGGGSLHGNPPRELANAAAGPIGVLGEWAAEKYLDIKPDAYAKIDLSRFNTEQFGHDLLYYQFRQIQEHALRASQIGGKTDWGLFKETYERNANQFWKQINALAEGKDPSQFGASSIFGEPIAAFKRYFQQAKGNFAEAYKKWQAYMKERYGEGSEALKGASPGASRSQGENIGSPDNPLDISAFAGRLGMKTEGARRKDHKPPHKLKQQKNPES